MAPRLDFHALLISLLGSDHVYFQPPPTVKMEYPCIIYHRFQMRMNHADNRPYKFKKRYQVTVVDTNPDGDIVDKVALLPSATYVRFYTVDNLNHDVFTIFF